MASRSGVSQSPAFEALVGTTPFRDRIAVRISASPDEIFEALRTVTLHDMKLACPAIFYELARERHADAR